MSLSKKLTACVNIVCVGEMLVGGVYGADWQPCIC